MTITLEPNQFLKVRSANEHNLKNVDTNIPKNKLIVMKTSHAFFVFQFQSFPSLFSNSCNFHHELF